MVQKGIGQRCDEGTTFHKHWIVHCNKTTKPRDKEIYGAHVVVIGQMYIIMQISFSDFFREACWVDEAD